MAKGKEFLIGAVTCVVATSVLGVQAVAELAKSKTITDMVLEQNYTPETPVKHELKVMQKGTLKDNSVYTFINITEQTEDSVTSEESGYTLKTVVQQAETFDSMSMVKDWLTETADLLTLFYEDTSALGIQKMFFYKDHTYTGILKYNGTVGDRTVPFVSLYQITGIDTNTYLETTCTNEATTEYDWKQNELCLSDICYALDLNYNSKDLGTLYKDNGTGIIDSDSFGASDYADENLFVFDTKTGTIVSFDIDNPNAPTTVKIPPTINGVEVKAIGAEAFYNKFDISKIRAIVIPDTVTHIGDKAFLANTALGTVTLPSGLVELGESAFNGCTSLREIEITGNVHEIKRYTFAGCRGLERVVLSDGTETIGDCAFENCALLQYVDNSINVKTIGAGAFKGTKVTAETFKAESVDATAFDK